MCLKSKRVKQKYVQMGIVIAGLVDYNEMSVDENLDLSYGEILVKYVCLQLDTVSEL